MIIFYGRNSGRIIRDAEDGTEPVAIVDIIIIEIGTTIIPCYPGIVVVVLLRKPLLYYLLKNKVIFTGMKYTSLNYILKKIRE